MNVAIFGGTFDPIHRGHLAIARAAQKHFNLRQIYFVPADIPPHKQKNPISDYHHRYTMVALATAGEKSFIASDIEAPAAGETRRPSYSLETMRRFRQRLSSKDRLFFLIGIDAFLDISKWYKTEELLCETEFIVASRPGFSLDDIARALPAGMRPATKVSHSRPAKLSPDEVIIHLLPEVREKVSATNLRTAAASGRPLGTMVPKPVAEYIRKTGIY